MAANDAPSYPVMSPVDAIYTTDPDACAKYHSNTVTPDGFCDPVHAAVICWPPTRPGSVIKWPCPAQDSKGRLVPTPIEEAYVAIICQKNGTWSDNITNFELCEKFIEELYTRDPYQYTMAYVLFIGCFLSIVTLCISLLIFCYFKSLQCSRLQVHRNLCVALIIHLTCLLTWSTIVVFEHSYITDHEWLCKVLVAVGLFSALASTNWMFLEGLLLHNRLTVNIFKQDAPFKAYYFIGWVLPTALIAVWVALTCKYNQSNCWNGISKSRLLWIITGPMLIGLLVNTVFLVNIIRVLLTKHRTNNTEETPQIRRAVKATALLFPLLGIPHLIFAVSPGDNEKDVVKGVYNVLISLMKSTQGLFIGILYCFMNSEVQAAVRNAYMRFTITRNSSPRFKSNRGLSQTSHTYVYDGAMDGSSRQKISLQAQRKLQDRPLVRQIYKHNCNNKDTNSINFTSGTMV